MDNKLFISSGFDQVNLSWIIPILNDFIKLRKIDGIVFESKLDFYQANNNPKFKKILNNYNNIFFKTNYLITFLYFLTNFFKVLKFLYYIFKKQIIIKNNWEDTQILHAIWDSAKLNLSKKEYIASNFDLLYSTLRVFYKYFIFLENQKKYKFRTLFLSHSVYHYRTYIVASKKLKLEIFNSGFFNLHRQSKENDVAWWSLDKKVLNKITNSIKKKEASIYFLNRERGKSNYTDATLSNFKFKRNFLYPKNVIFLHIFKDSPFNYIDKKRIFNDYNDWIISTIKIINDSKEKWSFRLHPSHKEWGEDQKFIINNIVNKYSTIKKNIIIDDNSVPIKHIFKYAKRCITFSGTIHLESAAYGIKPIVISNVMLNKYVSDSVFKPKTLDQYKKLLLLNSNSPFFKVKKNRRFFAKKLIFVRENALLLKNEFNIDFIYRRDANNKKKISKILTKSKNKIESNKKYINQIAIMLHYKFSHTLSKRFIKLFLK